jgi:hypothetical protein
MWNKEAIEFLKKNYPTEGIKFCAKHLNKTEKAVAKKACDLGIKKNKNTWTDEEIRFIKKNYNEMTLKEMSNVLGRTTPSIQTKGKNLGLHSFEAKEWSDEDTLFVKNNYLKMGVNEIASKVNRSYSSVRYKAQLLGIKKYTHKEWTETEVHFLKDNYPDKLGYYCSEKLERSFQAVHKMAQKLNLKPNWKHWSIDSLGYKVLTHDKDNKIHEHRYVMESFLGRKLSSDEIIHHKDKNKLNNDISNLEIVSRSEHINIHRDDLNQGKNKI